MSATVVDEHLDSRAVVMALPVINKGSIGQIAGVEAEAINLRAANSALRDELALRDRALDAIPTFFLIAKLQEPEAIIKYCNRVVADQLGFLPQELIGRSVNVLTQWAATNPRYKKDFETALRSGQTFSYEGEVSRVDGTRFWLGVTIRAMYDQGGKLTDAVIVGADISAKYESKAV